MPDFTFNGFEPANTTPVPDVLFDELLPYLNEAQLKVLLYVIRRTLGFKKTVDAISLNQFQHGITTKEGKTLDHGCGLKNRTAIIRAAASLETMGCLHSDKGDDPQGDKSTTLYRIRFRPVQVVRETDYLVLVGSARNGLPLVRETDYGSPLAALPVVRETHPQETVLQQTVRQDTDSQESVTPTESKSESSDFASAQSSHATFDPEQEFAEMIGHDPSSNHHIFNCHNWRACNGGLQVASCADYQAAIDGGLHEAETEKRPAIKLNGANHDTPTAVQPDHANSLDSVHRSESESGNGTVAIASKPGEVDSPPAIVPQSLTDGAATVGPGSRPRPSPEKPKRRKKPVEVQLTLHEQEIKEWYEELRGVEVSFSKRNVTALQALAGKKGSDDKENFLNIAAILDGDKWFEDHKIGVDLYWINFHWDNKIIFLQRRKKPAKPAPGATPYNNLDLLFAQITPEGV